MRLVAVLSCVSCAAFAIGCAARPVPVADMAKAKTTIRVAGDVGAGGDATASLYLSLAKEELAKAEARVSRGDNAGARSLAERARIDAELAIVVAREAGVREAVERTQEEAALLRDELQKVTSKAGGASGGSGAASESAKGETP